MKSSGLRKFEFVMQKLPWAGQSLASLLQFWNIHLQKIDPVASSFSWSELTSGSKLTLLTLFCFGTLTLAHAWEVLIR